MRRVVIFGAGPAGLTAGYESLKSGLYPVLFEQDRQVGGIAKTVNYKGCLFDIGGHRFFTKHRPVHSLWEELLGADFQQRFRLSRIYYDSRYFDYPLKPGNALTNLGILESARVVFSYLAAQFRSANNIISFEDWVTRKFGKRLFDIFFKTYTEKVWGIDCRELRADWASQRIKSLSLAKAVLDSFGLMKNGNVTSLIERFHYPNRGPGQMWDRARDLIEMKGGRVELCSRVTRIRHEEGRVVSVTIRSNHGQSEVHGDHYISSLPLRELILSFEPAPPDNVIKAALGLRYRDFFTVGLIVNKKNIFPDNWIYIHSPHVLVGRIQNFKNWSPMMVPRSDQTSLGLEYFCFETDNIWGEPDEVLIRRAGAEIESLALARFPMVVDGTVIRSPKAYPIYDEGYRENVRAIKDYLSTFSNLQTVGRNGLHRYNNQDHSMLTAIAAVKNILGDNEPVWDVNSDDSYHES